MSFTDQTLGQTVLRAKGFDPNVCRLMAHHAANGCPFECRLLGDERTCCERGQSVAHDPSATCEPPNCCGAHWSLTPFRQLQFPVLIDKIIKPEAGQRAP